jgi:CO/xanthine dehydrogenase Mo-binding subunit
LANAQNKLTIFRQLSMPVAARGVSVQFVLAAYMAQVAEVEVSKDGAVRVRRVVYAVDCGTVVNPDTRDSSAAGRGHSSSNRPCHAGSSEQFSTAD